MFQEPHSLVLVSTLFSYFSRGGSHSTFLFDITDTRKEKSCLRLSLCFWLSGIRPPMETSFHETLNLESGITAERVMQGA